MDQPMIIAKFVRPDAALSEYDRLTAKNLLIVGAEYVVDSAFVHPWNTNVYLQGFKEAFNSCHFDFFKDGKEIDIVEEFRWTFNDKEFIK